MREWLLLLLTGAWLSQSARGSWLQCGQVLASGGVDLSHHWQGSVLQALCFDRKPVSSCVVQRL